MTNSVNDTHNHLGKGVWIIRATQTFLVNAERSDVPPLQDTYEPE
jgi:hypothetical protein